MRVDFDKAKEKIKAWVDTLDGGDMERLITDVCPCKPVIYDPDADEIIYDVSKGHEDFFAD